MKAFTSQPLFLIVAVILGLSTAWNAISPNQPREHNRGAQCHDRCIGIDPDPCTVIAPNCIGYINACIFSIGATDDCGWDRADCTGSGCGGWQSAISCPNGPI